MNNTINSNFYPNLIYGTYCFLNISNNSFLNSTENYGFFQVIAIIIEHNVSFEISNNTFDTLKNNLNGPVLKKILLIKNYCFRRFQLMKFLEIFKKIKVLLIK